MAEHMAMLYKSEMTEKCLRWHEQLMLRNVLF